MKLLILFPLLLFALAVNAQVTISGTIRDETGAAVPFATVYLDQVFEGGASDMEGNFVFQTEARGNHQLVVSAIGYQTSRQPLNISSQPITAHFTLKAATDMMNAVTVSAGSFGSGDKDKAALLKPLDIVTNAGAKGDIYKAIETLPGVSKVGEETGLFVRGGDAHETKTIIDGALVEKPFFSETPNLASRSRFDPFMFKGTTFTTGGYSAEWGGALSSILLLETQDIPDKTTSSIGLNMAGIKLAHQQVWNQKTTLMGDVSYNNLKLLFNAMPQNVDWVKEPESFGTNWAFRHKTKKGMIKSLLQHQRGKIGLHLRNFEMPDLPHNFSNKNSTTYWNTNYQGMLNEKWGIYAGMALNHSSDRLTYDAFSSQEESAMLHAKTTVYYDVNKNMSMKWGAESFVEKDEKKAAEAKALDDQLTALYAENDFSLGKRWAFRLGARAEYSSLLAEVNVAPRTSMAYKTGKHSQVSLAYGHFYQKPEEEYLFLNQQLAFERSTHLIANYQWITEERSFRIELYDKQYQALIKNTATALLNNSGNGFSRGIDLFWKDAGTLPNLDYWVSYSYIDAQRHYKDYPTAATPTFVTDHTLNIVANYSVEHLGLRPGFTYTFASGRRYLNPNSAEFLSDKTPGYHDVSVNLSYITKLFNQFTVLYGSLGNPFGFNQVFGYQYSADGTKRAAVVPAAKRTFFLGLFVNI